MRIVHIVLQHIKIEEAETSQIGLCLFAIVRIQLHPLGVRLSIQKSYSNFCFTVD